MLTEYQKAAIFGVCLLIFFFVCLIIVFVSAGPLVLGTECHITKHRDILYLGNVECP